MTDASKNEVKLYCAKTSSPSLDDVKSSAEQICAKLLELNWTSPFIFETNPGIFFSIYPVIFRGNTVVIGFVLNMTGFVFNMT